jgi:hypothetical protein
MTIFSTSKKKQKQKTGKPSQYRKVSHQLEAAAPS